MTDQPGSAVVKPLPADQDPESCRMTVGEHLGELRLRLILALAGFGVAAVLCLVFGEHVVAAFCRPLIQSMHAAGMNPQIYYREISDTFMVYIEISLISAAAIASPWIVYQLWQFVAAGLYPEERRTITKYVPLSLTLLVSGMLMLYFFVLPISIDFFFSFSSRLPISTPAWPVHAQTLTTQPAVQLPVLAADPANPSPNSLWINAAEHRVKLFFDGKTLSLPFAPDNTVTPIITLPEYIDMVVRMLIMFGLAFQLPLVLLALVKIGILDLSMLRSMRKYFYFGLTVLAGFIVPDVVTGMIALMIPLILLFELGVLLAWWHQRREADSAEGF